MSPSVFGINHKLVRLLYRETVVVFLIVSLSGAAHAVGGDGGGAGGATSDLSAKAEQECMDAISMARSACASAGMGSQGLNSMQQQYSQNMQNQSQQNGQSLQGQQGQQQGQADACKKGADLSGIIGALSGLMGGACLFAVSSCREACGAQKHQQTVEDAALTTEAGRETGGDPSMPAFRAEKNYAANNVQQTPMMRRMQQQCSMYAPGAGAAFAQAAAGIASMLMSGQCDQQAATAQQTPGPVAGGQDCNNPQFAATNITCICQKDPKSSYCQKAADMPSGLGYTAASGGPLGPGMNSNGPISDGAPIGGPDGQAKPSSGSQEMGGGGGGGGLNAGRGANALASNNDSGGDPRSNVPTGIIQGTSGGSGGAGAAGGGGGGGKGGGGAGFGRAGKDGFNLRDFLPKSASRNIAGMSISAKDGVTGPLGPSIFEKVTKQYQFQRRNMIQDR